MKYAQFLSVTALVLSFIPSAYGAENYTLDAMHTNIDWRISHFGFSNPSGKFARVEGTLSLDEAKPENSKVTATIAINNLVTGIDKLDEHLKSPDFFDAAQFPTATFASDKVEVGAHNTAKVYGTLTVHGVAKPVTLDVTLNKIGMNMMNKKTAGFSIHTTLKRSDFGMNKYLPGLGDDVDIHIESEANLAEASPATPAEQKK
jgi:polyisoprenoid-binding protein YceI